MHVQKLSIKNADIITLNSVIISAFNQIYLSCKSVRQVLSFSKVEKSDSTFFPS